MEQDMLEPGAELSRPRAAFFPRGSQHPHYPEFSLFNTYFFPIKIISLLQRAYLELSVSGAMWAAQME